MLSSLPATPNPTTAAANATAPATTATTIADAPASTAVPEQARCQLLAVALANTCSYYGQFVPAVRTSIAASMAPHEKVGPGAWDSKGRCTCI